MGLKPRSPSQAFAFRFYGCEPIEWREGANDGHPYEIAFQAVPDARAKETIAQIWESSLKTGPVTAASSKPWRWAGKSAALFLGERDVSSSESTAFFDAVRSSFERLNEACALEEVVFRGAWWEKGFGPWGRGAWDAWSVGQRREPIAAFSTVAVGEVDAAFERARRVVHLGEEAVRAAEAREEARSAAGAMSLAPPRTKPVAFAIPRDAARVLGAASTWQVLGSASGRIYTKPSKTSDPVSWLADDGTAMHWKQAPISGGPVVGTSGAHMLVAIDAEVGHQVVLIDLVDGSSRPIWRTEPEDVYVRGLWLGGSQMAVMTKTLRLFELGESGAVEVARDGEQNQAAHLMFGLFGDRVLLTAKSYGGINAYRIDRGALERFGQVPDGRMRLKHWPLPQCDGTRVTGVDQAAQRPVEVLNVEASWQAAFGAPPW